MIDKIQLMAERSSLQYPLNDSVCSGISSKEMKGSMKFLDDICQSAFHNRVQGLVYKGLSRITPENTVCLMGPNTVFDGYDVTKSSIYGVKMKFEYTTPNGQVQKLKRNFLMPYVDKHGLMYLSGGLYNARPVLFDKCLSPSENNVFIRLYKDKSRVKRRIYKVRHNGTTIQSNVIYLQPNVNHNVTKLKNSPVAALFLYLFIKFGYAKAMKLVLGFVPEIINVRDIDREDKDYLYYYSDELLGENQKYRNKFRNYVPTQLAIRVLKSDVTDEKKLVAAVVNIMYVFDHGSRVRKEDLENKEIWRVVLSNILFGNKFTIQDRLNKLNLHLVALDDLVDRFMVTRFRLEFGDSLDEFGDIEKDGFYGILLMVYQNFDKWVQSSGYITASCYDKRIECLYGLHYRTIISINQLATRLTTVKHGITNSIVKQINRGLTVGHVFNIRRSDAPIVALESVSVINDNKLFGLVTSMCLQLNLKSSSGNGGKSNSSLADSSTLLSPSHNIGGTTNALSKARVSPLQTLNIFAPFKNGTIVPCTRLLNSMNNLTAIVAQNSRLSSVSKIPDEFILTLGRDK